MQTRLSNLHHPEKVHYYRICRFGIRCRSRHPSAGNIRKRSVRTACWLQPSHIKFSAGNRFGSKKMRIIDQPSRGRVETGDRMAKEDLRDQASWAHAQDRESVCLRSKTKKVLILPSSDGDEADGHCHHRQLKRRTVRPQPLAVPAFGG